MEKTWMIRRALNSLVLIAAFAVSACGASPDRSDPKEIDPKKIPIIVVHGGYLSCKTAFSKPYKTKIFATAKKLIHRLSEDRGGEDIPYVVSCFSTSTETLKYTTYENPTAVNKGSFDDLYGDILNIVREVGHHHQVVVVGHSYGGWLAMRNILDFPSWVNVAYLATLDPISMKTCSPGMFVKSFLGKLVGVPTDNCTSAPKDLKSHNNAISLMADRWEQYFQLDYPFLHSSHISEAHNNDQVKYDLQPPRVFQAHTLMDTDRRVWKRITEILF